MDHDAHLIFLEAHHAGGFLVEDVVNDLHKQLSRIPGGRIQVSNVDIVSRVLSGGNNNVEVEICAPCFIDPQGERLRV